MGFRKREPLFSVLLGAGLHLLDSLRERLPDDMDDLKERVGDTYDTASDRVSRAADSSRFPRGSPRIRQDRTRGVIAKLVREGK